MEARALEAELDERARAVESLLEVLDRAPSGEAFIRQCLRTILRTWHLDAAAYVASGPDGRRVLTVDGQPPRGHLRALVEAFEGTGLVTDPPVPADAPKVWAVTHVAEVALQLDREGWSPEFDERSGLANVNGFRREVLLARSRFEHGEHPFGLVVLDVDDVDLLEWDVRDRVLERTGAALRDTIRRIDSGARIDDHRFGVVLEGADRTAVRSFLRRLRDRISDDPILTTVSYRIGVASCPEDSLDTTAVLRSATLRLDEGEVEMRALPGRRLDLVATVELGRVTTVPRELPATPTDPVRSIAAVPPEAADASPSAPEPTARTLRDLRRERRREERAPHAPPAPVDPTPPAPTPAPAEPSSNHEVIERTPPPVVPEEMDDRRGSESPRPKPRGRRWGFGLNR